MPPAHLYPTPTYCPPSPFHTAHPKPSHNGSVSYIWLKPHPRLAFHEGTTPPPPPPPCTYHHPTPMHCPQSPFHMPRPKPSHDGSVLSFWLKPHPPPCVSQKHHPTTTTTTSYAPPPRPYALSSIAVSHAVPKTEP